MRISLSVIPEASAIRVQMATVVRGASVAGYRLEEEAGRGGMGVVYRARDTALDRVVALKVIAPELAKDPKFRARFIRESRATAGVDHPNVIPVYEAAEDEHGQLYIAMRFVDGHDLGKLLAENGPLSPALAADIVAQAASALDAAHVLGLVHRDVKPGNVLVTDGDRPHVYLTDFGLVKWEDATTAITTTDSWLGTPDYIAPEQVDGRAADARTDVYALGCVLYASLTGRPPFSDVPRLRKAGAHMHDRPPLLRDLNPLVPPAFEAVVTRALSKAPEDRFQSAGQLGAAALQAARSQARTPDDTAKTIRQRERPERTLRTAKLAQTHERRIRLRPVLIAGLALLAVAGGALAAALGAFSSDGAAIGARKHHHRAVPKPPPQPVAFDTVRCATNSCTQGGQRVQTPIDGGNCTVAGRVGIWERLDKQGPPMFGCQLDSAGQATASMPMPDVIGARVDWAQNYLDGLGIGHDTLGGGLLGILDESNWMVCASSPKLGATVAAGTKVKLFADHSC
jgi:serine/threonine protein kinase